MLLAVGLLVLVLGPVRLGGALMAFVFILAAAVRGVFPEHSGWLQLRSRAFDVVTLGALGVVLLVAVFAVNLQARV